MSQQPQPTTDLPAIAPAADFTTQFQTSKSHIATLEKTVDRLGQELEKENIMNTLVKFNNALLNLQTAGENLAKESQAALQAEEEASAEAAPRATEEAAAEAKAEFIGRAKDILKEHQKELKQLLGKEERTSEELTAAGTGGICRCVT